MAKVIDTRVSVIIPTRNSSGTIKACLVSIKEQTYADIEVIVVDESSCDDTVNIARKIADRVYSEGVERSQKRNIGAEYATGEYFLFIDSDMVLTPNVVSECIKEVRDNGVDIVVIPEISVGEGFWAKCKSFEKSLYVNDEYIDAARFFPRQRFQQLGGFDEGMVGAEDWDIHARAIEAGYNVSQIPSHIIHNEGRLSVIKTAKKKRSYSQAFADYRRRHPERAKRQLTPFRDAYRRGWVKMVRHPILTLGFVFIKFCEGIAAFRGLTTNTLEGRNR